MCESVSYNKKISYVPIKKIYSYYVKYLFPTNEKLILIGTPEYGNLGDQAIALAEEQFVRDNYGMKTLEISGEMARKVSNRWLRHIIKDKTILIQGGGYLGRRDKEKVVSEDEKQGIIKLLEKIYSDDITYTDTVLSFDVSQKKRLMYVSQKIEQFSKAEIVVTDRLHGMVMAYLAGTKVIAFGNCNYKVKGIYEWIKTCPEISYIDKVVEFSTQLTYLVEKDDSENVIDYVDKKYIKSCVILFL